MEGAREDAAVPASADRGAGAAGTRALLLRVAGASAGGCLVGMGGSARAVREGGRRGPQPLGLARRGLRPRGRDDELSRPDGGARRREGSARADHPGAVGPRGRVRRSRGRAGVRAAGPARLRGRDRPLHGPLRARPRERPRRRAARPRVRHGGKRLAHGRHAAAAGHEAPLAVPGAAGRALAGETVRWRGRERVRLGSPAPGRRRLWLATARTTTATSRNAPTCSCSRPSPSPSPCAWSARSKPRSTSRADASGRRPLGQARGRGSRRDGLEPFEPGNGRAAGERAGRRTVSAPALSPARS